MPNVFIGLLETCHLAHIRMDSISKHYAARRSSKAELKTEAAESAAKPVVYRNVFITDDIPVVGLSKPGFFRKIINSAKKMKPTAQPQVKPIPIALGVKKNETITEPAKLKETMPVKSRSASVVSFKAKEYVKTLQSKASFASLSASKENALPSANAKPKFDLKASLARPPPAGYKPYTGPIRKEYVAPKDCHPQKSAPEDEQTLVQKIKRKFSLPSSNNA